MGQIHVKLTRHSNGHLTPVQEGYTGVVGGGWGCGRAGAAQALFTPPSEAVPAGPPTCPFDPTFLSRSTPRTILTVMEIAERSALFFVGNVHQIEICKGDNVDADSEIHFAISGVAPPVRPTTLWHLLNTAPASWLPGQVYEGSSMVYHMCM